MANKKQIPEDAKMVDPSEVLNTNTFDFSQKANLLALHKILIDLNVRSIGDLEVAIARA